VAVFVEDGFPMYGGMPALPPPEMVAVLRRRGIEAETLSVKELSDSNLLNAGRVTVLVMPYGNAFPKPAFANLRAFHAAGGCLVMNSVPFCHPCEMVKGKWVDLGHEGFFGHDAKGIGTGSFWGPMPPDRNPRASIPGHPLGLDNNMLPDKPATCQCIDQQSLDLRDQVLPLINVGVENDQHPAAALVRHNCSLFRGARDVWMGPFMDELEEPDRYLVEQVLVRGVLWCLLEKRVIATSVFREKLAELGNIPKPKPLPDKLQFAPVSRAWGDTYVPKSKPPARELLVVDAERLSIEERIALACLQGLTSREQPRIWIQRGWVEGVNDRPYQDQTWLDWHKTKGYIDHWTVVTNWTELFQQFSNCCKGAIVPDSKLYRGDLLAVNVGACEDLIVATPDVAQRLGLPVKIDLRDRFKTYAEGMRWVWTNYKNKLNHGLCNYLYPSRLRNCAFAFDFQWRGVVFWLTGPIDQSEPGVDAFAERREIAEILSEMEPNVAVLGYPWHGDGVGLGEGAGVEFASRYAKGLIPSDYLANTCIMSGVRVGRLVQSQQPTPPPLDKDSIYIALALSDGDNQGLWMGWFKRYFEDPSFGKFPLAFGMGPEIRELMPAVAQWYYERASPQTEFIADVCGCAYIHPGDYGLAFAERARVFGDFLSWTARAMESMDMRTVRAGGNDEILGQYARALPFCHSLFPDYGRRPGFGDNELTYSLSEGRPVFRAVMSGRYGKQGFLREVRETFANQRPAFVNGFINCWDFDPKDIATLYEKRDANMVFVTPKQLALLYREARNRGLLK
jgi:hypothetical protein